MRAKHLAVILSFFGLVGLGTWYLAERPDVLQHIPCYCGCSGLGHTSNLTCFVKPGVAAGGFVLEAHGAT